MMTGVSRQTVNELLECISWGHKGLVIRFNDFQVFGDVSEYDHCLQPLWIDEFQANKAKEEGNLWECSWLVYEEAENSYVTYTIASSELKPLLDYLKERKKITEFEPNWCSPPAETILYLMNQLGINEATLRNRLRLMEDDFLLLMHGNMAVTPQIAEFLSQVLGCTTQFWLDRELYYRQEVSRAHQESK